MQEFEEEHPRHRVEQVQRPRMGKKDVWNVPETHKKESMAAAQRMRGRMVADRIRQQRWSQQTTEGLRDNGKDFDLEFK